MKNTRNGNSVGKALRLFSLNFTTKSQAFNMLNSLQLITNELKEELTEGKFRMFLRTMKMKT